MTTATPLRTRAARLCELFPRIYPDAHCELDFSNPLELLIATILSAQCTDVQVNKVTPEVFRKYRTALEYAEADPVAFEHDLRAIGLYRNKAKNIRACCRLLVDRHGGEVPQTMDALVELPGSGARRPTWCWAMPSGKTWAWWWIRTWLASPRALASRRKPIRRKSSPP